MVIPNLSELRAVLVLDIQTSNLMVDDEFTAHAIECIEAEGLDVHSNLFHYGTDELYLIHSHIEDNKDPYVCPRCGSTNVQEKAWVWSNTLQWADSLGVYDYFCDDCLHTYDEHVTQSMWNERNDEDED